MSPKLLTVFGATGNQGGSVISFILSTPALAKSYRIRAITRDPSKSSAKALADRGCEVVTADLDDPASLRAALKDSYAVYSVTNFWEHMDGAREERQGKNVADAAKDVGVKHLVWSSLPHATKVSGGALTHVEHFDRKADVETYIEGMKGEMWASYYMPAFYMPNFKTMITKGQDGKVAFTNVFDADETALPCVDPAADTGKWVAGILEKGAEANGARVQAVGNWASPREMVSDMSKELGIEVAYNQVSVEVFKGFMPANAAEELAENMLLVKDFSYYGKGSEKLQGESDQYLYPGAKVTTFRDYVRKSGPWFQ